MPLQSRPAAVNLRSVIIPGGLGAHKWRDRRLVADMAHRVDLGPWEHLLITDTSGDVLETDKANIFTVSGGVLRTPPADGRILPGITRQAVLQGARRAGISTAEETVTWDRLLDASEVFATNSVYGVIPVRSLAGRPVSWEPGPVSRHIAATLYTRPGSYRGWRPATHGSGDASPPRRAQVARKPGVTSQPEIVLIDNYDSFTYNLVHMLSAAGCRVEVVRNDEASAAQIAASGPAGVVISPGPCRPADAGISIDMVRACTGRIPLLGICLGHQAIAAAFGASIVTAPHPVHGQVSRITHDARGVLAGLPQRFQATRYHSLLIDEDSLPAALTITAWAGRLPMALRHVTSPMEGVQFHPESILTTHGETIIRTFIQASRAARL
jgi:para-aminobenzoate synthetase / 4-amino-4-deoxychorismate lyase